MKGDVWRQKILVNGNHSVDAILDSGAGMCLISSSIADSAGDGKDPGTGCSEWNWGSSIICDDQADGGTDWEGKNPYKFSG